MGRYFRGRHLSKRILNGPTRDLFTLISGFYNILKRGLLQLDWEPVMHTVNSSDIQVHQLHSNYPLPAMNNQNAASLSSCCYLECGLCITARASCIIIKVQLWWAIFKNYIHIWTFLSTQYLPSQLLSKDVNFMKQTGPCWFCSYMNIYGSIKHHLVKKGTEVAIICDVDNDIRPHIIPLGESTLKRTDKPSCLSSLETCKFVKEHRIAPPGLTYTIVKI